MTSPPSIVWRIAAAVLWLVSVACLVKAIGSATAGEQALYSPILTPGDRLAVEQAARVADHWAAIGWVLQVASAAVLSVGISSQRVVRRIFVSLGILIGADGVLLLLMAVIVR